MQEVFEKIIKRFEEEAFVHAVNGQQFEADGYDNHANVEYSMRNSFDAAIEIVKQAVAEYNNGWIPVESGKLPEEYAGVEVTIEEITNDVDGKQYYAVRSWLQEGQWAIKKAPYNPKVIAWKYPTEPYRPKGE